MTENEMLRECLDAFRAMKSADDANRFLKNNGKKRVVYSGSGQNRLRHYMLDRLEQHLGIGKYSS